MITSVFKKSTPINYTLVVIAVLCFFLIYQFKQPNWTDSLFTIAQKTGLLVIIVASFFLTNFIAKKNALTKDSSYSLLFFLLMLCFFPSVWDNYNLIISNFFILLASRRLVSLQTLKAPKEKIFDASLWIFIASLFHFWAILFILLVYISIIFHVSRDYRNWLIPFVSFFFTSIVFVFYSLLIDKTAIDYYLSEQVINTGIDYFQNDFQNIALSIFVVFVVFFGFSSVFTLTSKPLNMQASYKKIIFSLLIGGVIYFISPNKNNDVLIFTFFSLAIMATNFIENSQNKIQQEIVLAVSIILSFFCFFSQL
ncbi:DUF6427 family protein [Flavobacterium sp.]|uniref:DUF6427 family protein n=1 Tax=Flavobacterium sp. TaxID=239 RepID=UPI002639F7EF|nr:DUF6427 family protein [Flavobacterium sp.]